MYLLGEWITKWILLLRAIAEALALPPVNRQGHDKFCLSADFVIIIIGSSEIQSMRLMEHLLKELKSLSNEYLIFFVFVL